MFGVYIGHRILSGNFVLQEDKQADLLRKAKDAEERAAHAAIPEAKEAWWRIAQRYRDLAKVTLDPKPY
jgi:hypothetical protein